MAGLDVVIVGSTVDFEVSRRCGSASMVVIGDFIGAQNVCVVVDFDVALQFLDVPDLFLLNGADGGDVLFLNLRGLLCASALRFCSGLGALILRGEYLCAQKQLAGY